MPSGQSNFDANLLIDWNDLYASHWRMNSVNSKAQWIKCDENGNFSICKGPVPPGFVEVEIPGLEGSSKHKHGRLIAEANWRARAKIKAIDRAAKRVVKL